LLLLPVVEEVGIIGIIGGGVGGRALRVRLSLLVDISLYVGCLSCLGGVGGAWWAVVLLWDALLAVFSIAQLVLDFRVHILFLHHLQVVLVSTLLPNPLLPLSLLLLVLPQRGLVPGWLVPRADHLFLLLLSV